MCKLATPAAGPALTQRLAPPAPTENEKVLYAAKMRLSFAESRCPERPDKQSGCWVGLVVVAGLALGACSGGVPGEGAAPAVSDSGVATAQPTVVPTPVGTSVPSPVPSAAVSATSTAVPTATAVSTPVPSPTPTVAALPTATSVPSMVLSPEPIWGVEWVDVPEGEWVSVSAGWDFACGLRVGGEVECWSEVGHGRRNTYGQLDAPEGQFSVISSGAAHSCGIRADRSIECWGNDFYGKLDAPEGEFTALASGKDHSCGIRADRTVECWGLSRYGLLDVPDGEFTAVDVSWTYSCGLRVDRSVVCWGDEMEDWYGQTPDGEFTAIASGWDRTCGLRLDGSVVCWAMSRVHTGVAEGVYEGVVVGGTHACGVRAQQLVNCGLPHHVPPHQYLAALPGSLGFIEVSVGGWAACGVRINNQIECWGDNDAWDWVDPLWFSLSANSASGTWTVVSSGGYHSCGIRVDRTVACWGDNEFGQTDAPGGEFISISAGVDHTCNWPPWPSVVCSGGYHTCGVQVGGAAVCWGDNVFGQVEAPGGEFVAVSAGGSHSCGVLVGGLLEVLG